MRCVIDISKISAAVGKDFQELVFFLVPGPLTELFRNTATIEAEEQLPPEAFLGPVIFYLVPAWDVDLKMYERVIESDPDVHIASRTGVFPAIFFEPKTPHSMALVEKLDGTPHSQVDDPLLRHSKSVLRLLRERSLLNVNLSRKSSLRDT